MDLLEIRKKAREKKEAEKAAANAAGEAVREESPAKPEPAVPAEKQRKKKAGARRKAKEKAPTPSPEASAVFEHETAEQAGGPEDEGFVVVLDEPEAPSVYSEEGPQREKETAAVQTPETAPAGPSKPVKTGGEAPPKPEAEAGPEEGQTAEDSVIEYLAFMLSDEEYAVKVDHVKEIIRLQRITGVPRAEEFVEGIISLRGVIIPVYDIKKRLGLDASERGRTARIVIVSDDESPQGIIVDKVTGVARLREGAIEPPPAVIGGVEGEYLEGVGRINDRLLILFNTRKILSMDGGVD